MTTQEERDKKQLKIGCALMVLTAIVVLIIIGVQMIPLIAPFVVAICALVCFIKYMWKDRPHVRAKFELSEYERESLADSKEKYNWALDKIVELKEIITNEGLRYTAGGKRLELRSHRAQDVQGAMDNANRIISEERPMCEYYMALPMKRYKEARKHFSRFWGFFLSFAVWGSLVLMAQPDKLLEHHLNQTGEAISFVIDLWDSDKHNNNNSQYATDTVNEANIAKELQPAKVQESEEPDITVWSAFVVLGLVYLSVFVVTYIFFSVKHKKPKGVSSED